MSAVERNAAAVVLGWVVHLEQTAAVAVRAVNPDLCWSLRRQLRSSTLSRVDAAAAETGLDDFDPGETI
jgi:hypothetical protein